MTEEEWLGETEPTRMWHLIRTSASERKTRRFALACARRAIVRAEVILDDAQSLLALIEEIADRPGETPISDEYYDLARRLHESLNLEERQRRAIQAAVMAGDRWISSPAAVSYIIHDAAGATIDGELEYQAQAALLRCIFSSPFRPVTVDPSWLTSTVSALASQMYESRDFSTMPILADALQDAGCADEEILNHCRGQGVHVRGCWVVDSCLSKK